MKQITTLFILTTVITLYASEAHAYIDPGTGALIIQALIGLIATGLVTIRLWWRKFTAFIGLGKKENTEKTETDEENHSED